MIVESKILRAPSSSAGTWLRGVMALRAGVGVPRAKFGGVLAVKGRFFSRRAMRIFWL